MKIVINETEVAIKEGNSPFAAILIDDKGNIIEKAHNTAKSENNPVLNIVTGVLEKECKEQIEKARNSKG